MFSKPKTAQESQHSCKMFQLKQQPRRKVQTLPGAKLQPLHKDSTTAASASRTSYEYCIV